MLLIYSNIGGIFQQDNATIHSARNVQSWFERNHVKLFSHPPYSPNLNPIENIQGILKNRLSKLPSSLLGKGASEKDINSFIQAIKQEWQKIPQKDIDRSILLLPRRYQAIVDAKGWYTRYQLIANIYLHLYIV